MQAGLATSLEDARRQDQRLCDEVMRERYFASVFDKYNAARGPYSGGGGALTADEMEYLEAIDAMVDDGDSGT